MTDMNIQNEWQLFEETLRTLLYLLPRSYNTEINDTNFYKLLRALALEIKDAKIEVQKLRNDMYLKTVSEDKIYENFGTLVKLKKNSDWDVEKYRGLISGIIQALLKGPTKQSLIDGVRLFTDLKVNVYELYKEEDRKKIDPNLYKYIHSQYGFVLEIEKPLDKFADQNALMRDVNYIVNIIKPAHTISIIIMTLIDEENYKTSYYERFKDIKTPNPEIIIDPKNPDYYNLYGMEEYSVDTNLIYKENIYGYDYKSENVFTTGISLIGGTDLIAPIYFLEDKSNFYAEYFGKEYFDPNLINEYYQNLLELYEQQYQVNYINYLARIDHVEETFKNPLDYNNFNFESANEEIFPLRYINSFRLSSTIKYSTLNGIDVLNPNYQESIARVYEYHHELKELFNTQNINDESTNNLQNNLSESYDSSLIQHTIPDYSTVLNENKFNTPLEYNSYTHQLNEQYSNYQYKLSELINEVKENVNLQNVDHKVIELHFNFAGENVNSPLEEISSIYNSNNIDNFDIKNEVTDDDNFQVSANHEENVSKPNELLITNIDGFEEVSTIVSIENIPRFILNRTALNASRLGGLLRDQVTMVMG